MIILGIDPGLDGALAVFLESMPAFVLPVPTLDTKKSNGKTKREYDVVAMSSAVRTNIGMSRHVRVGIERVHAMPKQGVASMFQMGRGLGVWEGIIAGCGLSYELITPQRWKGVMLDGAGKDKESARLKAIQLFPDVDLHRKADHNKAEALLIGEYMRRTSRF